jgi:LacI family transcriptional regulator
MRDVAAKAGVSATVVSRVLTGGCRTVRVSEATAQRVRSVADDLGYRLNVTAIQFRERATLMIGVLHGIGFERPRLQGDSQYFAALMDGIIDGAFQHGYSVTLCPKLFGQSPEDAMTDGRFDGLVWYSTSPSEDSQRLLERCSVPLVLIHAPANAYSSRFPTVMCDNDQGIGLAVDHLAEQGHRRIAFVGETRDAFGELGVRQEAFFRHMRAHGFEVSQLNVAFLQDGQVVGLFDSEIRFTAAVAVHDGVAARVLAEAELIGVEVPDQLSVVGFDSTPFCLGLRPRLTSVSQPLSVMGRRAVELLVQSIRDETPDPLALVLPCSLDVRDSTTSVISRN